MTTKYWVGNGGNWSDTAHWSLSSGGAGGAGVPTSENDVKFDINSFSIDSQTVIIDIPNSVCKSLDFTGVTNSPTFDISEHLFVFGDITFIYEMSVSGLSWLHVTEDATCILTTNGLRIECEYLIIEAGANLTLADNLSIKNFAVVGGIFSSAGFTINCEDLEFYGSGTIINIDGSIITVSGGYEYSCIMDGTTLSGSGATINIPNGAYLEIYDSGGGINPVIISGGEENKLIIAIDINLPEDNHLVECATFTDVTVTGLILDATDPTNIDGGGNSGIEFGPKYKITLMDNLTCENLTIIANFDSQEYEINSKRIMINPIIEESIIQMNSNISTLIFQIDDSLDIINEYSELLSNITIEEQG